MLASQLHRLAEQSAERLLPDCELLARFARSRDESAFAELVRRHGSLVLGVARRVLADHHAAEDVLQATFLLLARKAPSVNWRPNIAPWLYAAAYRLARKARRRRKFATLGSAPPAATPAGADRPLLWDEARSAIDEELSRLSRPLREPLVLCYLQGRTRDEAAKALGWSLAMLKRRLERGRKVLRACLTRRGLALTALGTAVALDDSAVSNIAAHELANNIAKGAISASAVALLESGSLASWQKLAIVFLLFGLMGIGGHWLVGRAPALVEPPEPPPIAGPQIPAKKTIDVSGDPLPEGAIARLGTTRLRPGTMIHAVEFSPDGKQMAVWARDWLGGKNDRLIFYNSTTGKENKSIPLPQNQFLAMRWLADGRGLAVVKLDRKDLFIWQFAGPVSQLPVNEKADASTNFPGDIQAAAISPDGRWIVTGRSSYDAKDQPLELWETKPNTHLAELKPRQLGMQSGHGIYFAFSSDGKLLFALSRKQEAMDFTGGVGTPGKPADRSRLVVYDLKSGKELNAFDVMPPMRYMEGSQPPPERLAVAPDAKMIWIGDEKGSIRAYDWKTGKETLSFLAHPAGEPKSFSKEAGVSAIHLTPNGQTLYTAGQFGGVSIREARTGATRKTIPIEQLGRGCFFAMSPDGARLAVVGLNSTAGSIRLFNAGGDELVALPGHVGGISEARPLSDGTVITAGWDNMVRWWDLRTGHELKNQRVELPKYFPSSSWLTSDGRGIFSVRENQLVYLDLATRKQTFVADVGDKPYARLRGVSGSCVLFMTADGKLVQWDAHTGAIRKTYEPPPHAENEPIWPGRATISPDERHIALTATASIQSGRIGYFTGGSITHYDSKTREIRRHWETREARFECCEFSPDGEYFAVGGITLSAYGPKKSDEFTLPISPKSGLLLFDGRTGDPIRAFEPGSKSPYNSYHVPAVTFSPCSHLLAAVQWDNSIAIYELATGSLCRLFRGHQNQVTRLEFTSDSRRLLSASMDSTALVWDTSYAKLAKPAADGRDKLWADLAKPEWQLAGPALAALAQKPDDFLALVKQNLPAADKPDVDREAIAKSVKQLDDQIFAVRERASASLSRLGRESLPLLREHLSKATSIESKTRLQRAIDQISRMPAPSGHLRQLRVLALLEQMRSPEAKQELERLARGHADAALTRDAKAALVRMATGAK